MWSLTTNRRICTFWHPRSFVRGVPFCSIVLATVVSFGCATGTGTADPARAQVSRAGKADCACGGAGKGGAICPMEAGASPSAVPQGSNAVQNEMRLLDHAVHASMTAATLGDVSIVPGLFHRVHQARALTDQALAAGTWKPARGDLDAFKRQDAAFHAQIETVVHAAVANDRTGVIDGLSRLLPNCIACHEAHREPGLPAMMRHMAKGAGHPGIGSPSRSVEPEP